MPALLVMEKGKVGAALFFLLPFSEPSELNQAWPAPPVHPSSSFSI